MSVAWSSAGRGGSVVARHEWKGLSKMPVALEESEKALESQSSTQDQRVISGRPPTPTRIEMRPSYLKSHALFYLLSSYIKYMNNL